MKHSASEALDILMEHPTLLSMYRTQSWFDPASEMSHLLWGTQFRHDPLDEASAKKLRRLAQALRAFPFTKLEGTKDLVAHEEAVLRSLAFNLIGKVVALVGNGRRDGVGWLLNKLTLNSSHQALIQEFLDLQPLTQDLYQLKASEEWNSKQDLLVQAYKSDDNLDYIKQYIDHVERYCAGQGARTY